MPSNYRTVVALRDGATGSLIMPLEKADISRLVATGRKPPIPITMTAHDGQTDIYGPMFVPTHLDPSAKYPIVNNVYPGPQTAPTATTPRPTSASRKTSRGTCSWPPYQTMLIADALIEANKDFDLLLIPNSNHGYGAASNYMMRRRWDYFVKWLLNAEPPKEFDLSAPLPGAGRSGG